MTADLAAEQLPGGRNHRLPLYNTRALFTSAGAGSSGGGWSLLPHLRLAKAGGGASLPHLQSVCRSPSLAG
jgi:hypothetical protein